MTKRFSLWALSLLVTALILLPQNASAATCTNAAFTGTYQYSFGIGSGTTAGTLTADGAGNFQFSEDFQVKEFFFPPQSYAGPVTPSGPFTGEVLVPVEVTNDSHAGKYFVNADCTMTLIFHPSEFNCFSAGPCYFPIHFDAVLVKSGLGFYLIATDDHVLASGAGVHL